MTVKVITDSGADLPTHVVRELGITVIPHNIHFGAEVYRDGIDLTAEQFYHRLQQDKHNFPATSIPSPAVFLETYKKLCRETEEILVITSSAKLSATYEVARKSVGLMKQPCRIEVLDSQWAIMAQGFVVITAARAAQEGASLDEVISIAQRNIHRVDFRAAFDTLDYLKHGGRIGKAQALLGPLLRVNPIIGLKNGEVFPFGRERSRTRAIKYIYDFALRYPNIEEMAVEDAACPDEAEALVGRLNGRFPKERIYRSTMGAVIGTHTGPGLLLVAVLGDK